MVSFPSTATKATAHAVSPHEQDNEDEPVLAPTNVQVMTTPRDERNSSSSSNNNNNDDDGLFKGTQQPLAYQDVPFAVLFWIQVLGIAGTAMFFGPALLEAGVTDDDASSSNNKNKYNTNDNDDDDDNDNVTGIQILLIMTCIFVAAALATTTALRVMMNYPTRLIQMAFFAAPVMFGVVAFFMTAIVMTKPSSPNDNSSGDDVVVYQYLWILAAVGAALSICWYQCLKRFIPFAATTLQTALISLRGHFGLYVLEVGLLVALYAYTLLWLFAIGGVYYHDHLKGQAPSCSTDSDDYDHSAYYGVDDDDPNATCDTNPMSLPIVFLFFLCLYWTQQVVQNLVHTTTSGVVGTWWFSPALGDPSCCGRQVTDSFTRAATYSFGSICFGSLLVSILQTLESMSRRRRRDVLTMVVQCLIMCLRAWLEYFNSWAFCYVGLYGYDYLTAGRNVIQLFRQRGWTTFIADRLVFRVLFMANLGVATLTGLVCLVMGWVYMGLQGNTDTDILQVLFWIGFLIGLYVSNTILFVVESATRTVMVLFAESAQEFAEIHEELYENLKGGWSTSYPEEWGRAAAPVVHATPVV